MLFFMLPRSWRSCKLPTLIRKSVFRLSRMLSRSQLIFCLFTHLISRSRSCKCYLTNIWFFSHSSNLTRQFHILLSQAPVYTIASNAGVEGSVVVGKLLEQDNLELGYDAAKGIISLFGVLYWPRMI